MRKTSLNFMLSYGFSWAHFNSLIFENLNEIKIVNNLSEKSIIFLVLKNLEKNKHLLIFLGHFLHKIYSQYTLQILSYNNNKINKELLAFVNKAII